MMIKKQPTTPRSRTLAATLLAAMLAATTAHATSDAWVGTTDETWATSTNWSSSPATVPEAGDTATFNSAGNGNTIIDLGAGVTVGSLVFDTALADAYTIGSGAVGSQTLTFGTVRNAITMNSSVSANQLFNSNLTLSVSSTANNQATYYAVTNDSLTNTLTLAGGISASTTGVKTLHVTGSGNTTISGAITSGTGNMSLFKTGSGTLTLSGGGTFSGTGVTDGANFSSSAVFREGLTVLNGGTYSNSNGELVAGGVATHGGAGTNTTLQLENDTTLNGITWLSIGRGNGNGTATSNLTLNGSSSISTERMSAGYNAGNALNLPKGTITLNGTSMLTATNTQLNVFNFTIGESAGSNISMIVNDSAVVNKTGGSVDFGNQTQGAVQIGREGTGAVTMNGGTFNAASTDLGRGVNNATAQNGTLTIKTGATYNNEGDFRTGFAGGASGRATLNVEGGTLNIGSTTKRKMVIGTWDSSQSTINVLSGGNLNLNTDTDIRFVQENNIGPNVMNLEAGGAITSYSDNKTTANGAGVLDLMWKGAAGSNNSFNLNGGTLTIRQVVSTTNNGTRTFNFNGGTLKATGDATAFFSLGTGSARANVRNGGAIIDTNGNNVTIGQSLAHSTIDGDNATDGGLTKSGTGTLTLSGANTYTGMTTISAGTLALASAGTFDSSSGVNLGTSSSQGTLDLTAKSAFTFGSSQAVSGHGTINIGSGKTVTIDGTLAPGNSPGIVSVTGSLVLGGASTTNMEIAGAGTAGTDYDLISVSETLTYGGALTITFIDSFMPSAGQSFDLFNSFTSQSGTFSSVTVAGTGLTALGDSSGFSGTVGGLNYTFLYSSGDLTVAASAIPEPSTYAAIFGGLALLGAVVHRRRRTLNGS